MTSTLYQFIGLVLGFALWAFLGVTGKVPLEPLIALLQMALGGLITHMLKSIGDTGTPPSAAPVSVPGQGGFASIRLLTVIGGLALGLAMLAGCTTTTASVYSGLYAQAKAGVQVFDDNTLSTMKDLVCAQPYSAIQRHPELQPGVVALCGPMSNTASLDPAQVMQMLSIAKQLGLVPAASVSVVK